MAGENSTMIKIDQLMIRVIFLMLTGCFAENLKVEKRP